MSTPRPVDVRSLLFPRNVDADDVHAEKDTSQAVLNQSVLRAADLYGALPASPTSRKQCSSPRAATPSAPASSSFFKSNYSGFLTRKRLVASPRVNKMMPLNVLPVRAPSPVGELPTDSVVSLSCLMSREPGAITIRSPRRAILGQSDVQKITKWLQSLTRESANFSSYALYCDMLFQESRVLTQGKPVPNRLQTAIAFHCLCKAISVFARHEDILLRICNDLGMALYMNHDPSMMHNGDIEALTFFTRLTTYYEQHAIIHQQKQDLQQEMLNQQAAYRQRLDEERARIEQLKHIQQQLHVDRLDQISTKKTQGMDLNSKLQGVLQHFQHVSEEEKEKIMLGTIEALNAQVSAAAVISIAEQMDPVEKDKLVDSLLQDEVKEVTQLIETQDVVESNRQQNTVPEQPATRPARFQTLLLQLIEKPNGNKAQIGNAGSEMDDFLCDHDRKVLEGIEDIVDELEREKKNSKSLEQRLEEAEKLVSDLRWKNNALVHEVEECTKQHEQQLQEVRDQMTEVQKEYDDKNVQTDEDWSKLQQNLVSRSKRKRHLAAGDSSDDLILKNRAKNKFGYGIANIIDQAKIAPSKVRKILSKRKPLALNELHSIIVGYYQTKMFQDVQNDSSGKPRTNLAQFTMEMYVLHYGLKDLAISQLVFLDASVRKSSRESARVRTFGLLIGSLDPESHACSVQGIDFFLLVVVIIFNAGVYKKGRKQAVTIAQKLKTFFGDGIFASPKSVTVKHELVFQTIDLAFSFTRNESGGHLNQLKDDIRKKCSVNGRGLDIDLVLEKIMNYWFVLYERQVQDIHDMFNATDTNGDGTLDFREFCELVLVLEPTMDRSDALTLYNRAAGEDNVIDKDEFLQVMLAHQRGVILEEFYGGVSNKKIIMGIGQRKKTFVALSAATGLDSLTAAMASMVPESLANVGEEDDVDSDDMAETEIEQFRKNVSFQILLRLSMWAAEAKVKLRRARQRALESTEASDTTVLLQKALQNAHINTASTIK